MKPKITHLERIEIKNLWGEFDINWQLDPNVNILIGINGSGKTTLLGIIESIFNGMAQDNYDYDKVKLSFNDNHFIISEPKQSLFDNSSQSHITNNFDFASFDIDKISTFDMPLKQIEYTNRKSKDIATELDILLEPLIDEFKSYQLKLSRLEIEATAIIDNKIKELSLKDSATMAELQELKVALRHKEMKVEEIYQQKEQFIFELNSLFGATHKSVEFDKNNSMVFRKNGKIITPYRLSTGEKQVLIILLKVILPKENSCILLLDEPELSLHLAWQLKLIDIIQSLNENCQIIIATHAPGIFSKGWRDKITKMEDIVFPS